MLFLDPLTPLQNTELVFKLVASIAAVIASIATSLALLVAAVWAWYRFVRQRENHPLIDFSVDIIFHKRLGEWWVVELIAFIENKGKVQHKVKDFDFELVSLTGLDAVNLSQEFNGQVLFPNVISKGSFRAKQYGEFFIEPGLKNKYSYIARVPAEGVVVMLHSQFWYPDGKNTHMAEVTKRVPSEEELKLSGKDPKIPEPSQH
jgi:hypothetical protein